MGQTYSRLSSSSSSSSKVAASIAAATTVGAAVSMYHYGHRVLASIYNQMIVHMTKVWYHAVLDQIEDGSVVLDVGIGTAGALLECSDLIRSKQIKIIGIDYNDFYVQAAKEAIEKANLQESVHVECISVYDTEKMGQLVQTYHEKVDHVYFSGSFSLLPDPMEALKSVSTNNWISNNACVFITQTYQRRTPTFFGTLKPFIKYITSIDFGECITEEKIQSFHQKAIQHIPSLTLKEHSVIPNSIDNAFQAAYMTIFQKKQN